MFRSPRFPVLLPARAGLIRDAATALDTAAPVIVIGDRGSGVTTFGARLLGRRLDAGRVVHRVTGSPALTGIPFASVAALGAQIPGLREASHSPVEMMGRIAQLAPAGPRTIFLDRAEHIDPASAAGLVQLAELHVCELVIGTADLAALPEDLQRLSTEYGTAHIALPALALEDTIVLLEDLLETPCDVSSAQRLQALAGGNPLLLRELALDARASGALQLHRGYLSLTAGWRARSDRVSQLLQRRLAGQAAPLREAVELAAVLGELPREIADRLLSAEQIERAVAERLLSVVSAGESGPERLVLGAGLAPETVVALLGGETLASTIERLRSRVPAELLTPNIRVQLATHRRTLGIAVPLDQLEADADAAARSRQFDAVIALTEGLRDPGSPWPDAGESAAGRAAAEGALRIHRSEAFLETGDPHTALEVLAPLLEAGDQDARLFASFVEFSGLGRPDLMQRRLVPGAAGAAGVAGGAAGDPLAPLGSAIPPEDAALCVILTARAGEHVSLATLRRHADDERLTHRLRLSVSAQLVSELSYLGRPGDGLAEYQRLRAGELWRESPPSQRGELLHTLLIAMLCDGDAEERYLPLFAGIDWDHLALDHATFLAAKGVQHLDTGDAVGAAQLLAQASALLAQRDPHLLAGFIGALDAAAAVKLGDRARARASFAQFQAGSVTSGQVARLEARRLSLVVVQALEGDDAARALLAELLAEAERRDHRHVRVRLLHEAWRLRLADEPEDADALSAAAAGVQGPYAATMQYYGDAFGQSAGESPERLRRALDAIIAGHRAAGRLLYAAEAAARGAEAAKARGEHKRASQLLDACAAAAAPLAGVHTPSLRRARIDPELLSEREFEVCQRAAAGLSNAEIAAESFVSPRTVEGHLQRAYGKLGVADRRMLLPPLAG